MLGGPPPGLVMETGGPNKVETGGMVRVDEEIDEEDHTAVPRVDIWEDAMWFQDSNCQHYSICEGDTDEDEEAATVFHTASVLVPLPT